MVWLERVMFSGLGVLNAPPNPYYIVSAIVFCHRDGNRSFSLLAARDALFRHVNRTKGAGDIGCSSGYDVRILITSWPARIDSVKATVVLGIHQVNTQMI